MSAGTGERRIPIGPLVGLLGAVLLLVSLFLDWWQGVTAFTVFEVLDLVLAGLALAAIASLAEAFGARLPGRAPGAGLALPLGIAALAIVVSQMLNDPPAIVGRDRGPDIGLWLALGGGALMVVGGVIAAARISLALDLERREPVRRRGEQASPTPEEPAAARMRRRAAARAEGPEDAPEAQEAPDARTASPYAGNAAPDARPASPDAPTASPDALTAAPEEPTAPIPDSERVSAPHPREAPERPGDGRSG